jgi:hypothetical protein
MQGVARRANNASGYDRDISGKRKVQFITSKRQIMGSAGRECGWRLMRDPGRT